MTEKGKKPAEHLCLRPWEGEGERGRVESLGKYGHGPSPSPALSASGCPRPRPGQLSGNGIMLSPQKGRGWYQT